MEVSVIIPVFNAETYITKAIESALQHDEVKEVVVVNDGSTDGSLTIIKALKNRDERVKVFHHKNKENRGRSESRNLGIQKATSNYIAFLDADDFYLENRFINDRLKFEADQSVEGVYNAIGVHFYREYNLKEQKQLELYTVKKVVKPEKLFIELLSGKNGHFSIDGLTIKKSVFSKVGFFSNKLEVAEDTELIWKMAMKCKLVSGNIIEPVAMRGVHENNIFNNKKAYTKTLYTIYQSLLFWSSKNKISKKNIDELLNRIWIIRYKKKYGLLKNIQYWFFIFFKMPRLFCTYLSIKYFPVVRFRQTYFSIFYKKSLKKED